MPTKDPLEAAATSSAIDLTSILFPWHWGKKYFQYTSSIFESMYDSCILSKIVRDKLNSIRVNTIVKVTNGLFGF